MKNKNNLKSFYQHLNDLRKFIIILIIIYIPIFIACFYYASVINDFLSSVFLKILNTSFNQQNIIATNVFEVFTSYLKIAFFSSLFIYLPFFLLAIFCFISQELSQKEKKIAFIIAFLSPILFFLGGYIGNFIFLKIVWTFFINVYFNSETIILLPKISEYISFSLNMILLFGIIFQTPLVLMILALFKIVTIKKLIKYFKYYILMSFILGAILTPADPLSQIFVAGVLITLYLITIPLIKIIED